MDPPGEGRRMRGVETYASLAAAWLDRRSLLRVASAGIGGALVGRGTAAREQELERERVGLRFAGLEGTTADVLEVPEGYRAQPLLCWGDPIFPQTPAFRLDRQSARGQERRFGFNADFSAFFPLADGDAARGILCVNHEYPAGREMFPGFQLDSITREQVQIQMAANGMSVVEIRLGEQGDWEPVLDSKRNRRITVTTEMELCGPARGDELLRTRLDPDGTRVAGMIGNCAGGKTPWGTVLTCEENLQEYFGHTARLEDEGLAQGFQRYGLLPEHSFYHWERHEPRFDVSQEPHECNRFGWVVEIDPLDPASTPRKRTALGRFRHEGAATALADDGRAVVYLGDDDNFEYLFKFVSTGRFEPEDRAVNRHLLDRGTLYVARFHTDGRGEWLPLVPAGVLEGWSPARLMIHARLAADLLGATPMDRPEDVEVNPFNHRVYVCMTKNKKRLTGDGGPNPRAHNKHGHVLELDEYGGDLGATRFSWSPFLLGGTAARGGDPLSCPDNIAFDGRGNLWVATDGQGSAAGINDSVYAVATAGPERGVARRFLNGPVGAEICGPEFTPDGRTFFVCMQHPGEGGGLEEPNSRWPHDALGVPRPGIVAVQRADGGPIGE